MRRPTFQFIRLSGTLPEPAVLRLLPEELARKYAVFPIRYVDGKLDIACLDPFDTASLNALAREVRKPLQPYACTYPDIRAAINRAYRRNPIRPISPDELALLLRLGMLKAANQQQVEQLSTSRKIPVWQACLQLGLINEREAAQVKSWLEAIPFLGLEEFEPKLALAALVPWETAQRYHITPIAWMEGALYLASPGSLTPQQMADIERQVCLPIRAISTTQTSWDRLFRRLYLHGPAAQNRDEDIAQVLVDRGFLAEASLAGARTVQSQTGKTLERTLFDLNLVDRKQWLHVKAATYDTPFEEPRIKDILPDLIGLIPEPIEKALVILPLREHRRALVLGVSHPSKDLVQLVQSITGRRIETRLIDEDFIHQALGRRQNKNGWNPGNEMPSLEKWFVGLGYLSEEQMKDAIAKEIPGAKTITERLLKSGYIEEVNLAEGLSAYTGLPYSDLERFQIKPDDYCSLPADILFAHLLLPILEDSKNIWVACADPFDGKGMRKLEQATGKMVSPVIAPKTIIQTGLYRLEGREYSRLNPLSIRITGELIEQGILTQLEASHAVQSFASGGMPLDKAILHESTYPPEAIGRAIARLVGAPFISLLLREERVPVIGPLGEMIEKTQAHDPVDESVARLLSLEDAQKFSALPIRRDGSRLVVAFADPLYQATVKEIEKLTDLHVTPVFVLRTELEEAIQRSLRRRNLGTYLHMAGLISRQQLNRALDLARNTGVRLGRALVNMRVIRQEELSQFLAKQSGLPYLELSSSNINKDIALSLDPTMARKYGILPLDLQNGKVLLATIDPLNDQALEAARNLLKKDVSPVLVSETAMDQALESLYSQEYLAQSVSELLERTPDDSAFRVLSRAQLITLIIISICSILWLAFNLKGFVIFTNAISTFFYISFSAYKLFLIYQALNRDLEVPVTDEEVEKLQDKDLPVYTILVPVYKEAEILPALLNSLGKFNYPPTKLDIQVLMEEDDKETIQAFHDWDPPSHFQGIVVPTAHPKTKPKACNYGLIHAKGDFVVIYDAEDRPEPDQLKKVMVAFSKVSPEVVCIQSKLNYYNQDQNMLTRWFTVEYSMWFDLFLPGLDASGAPIPLGGTSNHFRREALIEAGAWDPYNVTEDADLGIRLYKRGFKTAIVDSTTFEEANSQINNWIRQRSRWIKGYIQTWLVHMRHPLRLMKDIGLMAFLGFQFVVGGTFFAALANPIYWLFTTLWFLFKWQFVQQVFPPVVFYLGAICLFFGNFAFTYINVAGALRRKYYGMVKYALLSPLYWGLTSVAAWRGFIQLIRNPSYWEKTIHGLTRARPQPDVQPDKPNQGVAA